MSDEKKCFFFYKIGPFANGQKLETKWYTHTHPWQPREWLYTSTTAGSVGVHLTNECANLDDTWKPLADHRMTLDEAKSKAEELLNCYLNEKKSERKHYYYRIEKMTGGVPRIGKWNTCVKGKRWVKELYGTYVILSTEENEETRLLHKSTTLEEAKIIAEWLLIHSFANSSISVIFDFSLGLDPRVSIDNHDKLPDCHLDDFYKVVELLHQASGVIGNKTVQS